MTSVEWYFDGEKYKVIFVGDSGVGKTSLFWRYLHNEPLQERKATIVDFGNKKVQLDDRQVRLCVWDTAGQERFRSIVATYFKSCHGVVLVCDLTNPSSWHSIQQSWYPMAIKRVPQASFLLLGNKKDMQTQVDLTQVRTWCAEKGVYFVEVSAWTGESVQEALFTLAALIDSKEYSSPFSSFGKATGATTSVGVMDSKSPSFMIKGRQEYRIEKQKTCC